MLKLAALSGILVCMTLGSAQAAEWPTDASPIKSIIVKHGHFEMQKAEGNWEVTSAGDKLPCAGHVDTIRIERKQGGPNHDLMFQAALNAFLTGNNIRTEVFACTKGRKALRAKSIEVLNRTNPNNVTVTPLLDYQRDRAGGLSQASQASRSAPSGSPSPNAPQPSSSDPQPQEGWSSGQVLNPTAPSLYLRYKVNRLPTGEKSLWELSDDATGFMSGTVEARTFMNLAAYGLARVFVQGDRFTQAELTDILDELNITPSIFTSAQGLRGSLRAIDRQLRSQMQQWRRTLQDPNSTADSRKSASRRLNAAEFFLYLAQVPPTFTSEAEYNEAWDNGIIGFGSDFFYNDEYREISSEEEFNEMQANK